MSQVATETVPIQRTFAGAMETLRTAIPGWEVRTQQTDLAAEVEQWIAGIGGEGPVTSMFAQAGTGTGKSLLYLIPSIQSGKRVVISVTTKALQDQLAGTDLPMLSEHLGGFTWAVLKGRGTYLCLNRLTHAEDSEVPSKAALLEWAASEDAVESEGTREALPIQVEDREWRQICSESDECSAFGCSDKKSPTYGSCYAQRARIKARSADIAVVNHSLFFADLNLRVEVGRDEFPGMLGHYDLVVADEGHEARAIASESLASRITLGTFKHMVSSARSWTSRYGTDAVESNAGQTLDKVARFAQASFEALPKVTAPQTKRLTIQDIMDVSDPMVELIHALDELHSGLETAALAPGVDSVKADAARNSLIASAVGAQQRLSSILGDEMEDTVRWVAGERTARGEVNVVLRSSPIDIAPYLRTNLFSKTPVLIISATLAVGGKFDFAARELGVDNYVGKIVGTPFDFQKQARLYMNPNLPNPSGASLREWESAVMLEILELVRSAQGRSLILFPAKSLMRKVRDFLADSLGYPVKMQGDAGESTESLKRWFLSDPENVLLGTKSFFTGFDPKGENCTQVIIVKFPFPVPDDPLTEARSEAVQARGDFPFTALTVPETSLVLQQMAGRAIRHTTDMAVIAILDPRAQTKGYGKGMVRDLGDIPSTTDRAEIANFQSSIRDHFERIAR